MKKRLIQIIAITIVALLGLWPAIVSLKPVNPTPTPGTKATRTPTEIVTPTITLTPSITFTATETLTPTETIEVTITDITDVTDTPTPTQVANIVPYPSAPLCASEDNNTFHTLWDSARGCHYDHEHGTNPFTAEVAATFPGFDLRALQGGVEIGHTNLSSPMENTMKHGGMKWDVMLSNPHGCVAGFEGGQYCISAVAIQYHNFGDYSIEMEARIHSAAALLKVCNPASPSDCGYLYTVQHEEYGQRITPYQGTLIPYPNSPVPSYDTPSGPYLSIDCVGAVIQCRSSLDFITSRLLNTNSIWTSKATGMGTRPPGSTILRVLFRVRDTYQVFDNNDFTYPFTFLWVCSSDNGLSFNPVGCRWNNTTSKVHEIGGVIPATWDNLAGFDTNPTIGRITADGFTDKFGLLTPSCTQAGGDCFPIKMIDMFVGVYGDYLLATKPSNPTTITNPERDIYFCNGTVCNETVPGAEPSEWPGASN